MNAESASASTSTTLTERAHHNHEKLFPGRVSTLRETDPEFIALFDNWAFDEVLGRTKLEDSTRLLLILAALMACQAQGEYRVMLPAALKAGVSPVAVKEVLYQSVPYIGVAKTYDFLGATNEILRDLGVSLPLPGQARVRWEERREQGDAVLKEIFGEVVLQMRRNTPPDEMAVHEDLSGFCFGDLYTRGGLELPLRELVTYVFLISLGGCEPQVRAHIGGNLRMGNDRGRLIDATLQLLPYIGFPRTLNALRAIDEVVPLKTGHS